jgi:curved DNA-binding protein CbpA
MNTLYDVLGIDRNSNAQQIEQAHQSIMASIANKGGNAEEDMVREKAVKEAFAILSSPSRRQAYDDKLRRKDQPITYEVVEKPGMPWISMAVFALILAGAFGVYQSNEKKVELARIALEAEKAKVAAEEATKLAEAEAAKLARQQLQDKFQLEQIRMRETERARADGQRIHYELQMAETQAMRERESADRNARNERLQEERAAQQRVQQQTYNMQRALAIPIPRR